MDQKYVVIVMARHSSEFKRLLQCNKTEIVRYIRNLGFGDSLKVYFFSLEELAKDGDLGTTYGDVNCVYMDETKSLSDFAKEIDGMLDRLGIEE